MDESTFQRVLITEAELLQCARMTEARFENPEVEASRVDITRRFLTAAFAAEKALRMHSRCALVNHCGTHGSSNLGEASEALFQALLTYADVVRETASRYVSSQVDARTQAGNRLVLEVA